MRQRLQPRQAEEAARTLDGVDEPKDVGENFGVVGLALEAHQFDIDDVETLARLGEEFAQKVVHGGARWVQKA